MPWHLSNSTPLGYFFSRKIKHSSNITCWNSMGSHTCRTVNVCFYYFRTGNYFCIYFCTLKDCFSAEVDDFFLFQTIFFDSSISPQLSVELMLQDFPTVHLLIVCQDSWPQSSEQTSTPLILGIKARQLLSKDLVNRLNELSNI